jgi:hypothetical protein
LEFSQDDLKEFFGYQPPSTVKPFTPYGSTVPREYVGTVPRPDAMPASAGPYLPWMKESARVSERAGLGQPIAN